MSGSIVSAKLPTQIVKVPEFSTTRSKENNPFDRMMMVNGFITFKKPTELRPSEPVITAEKIELKIPPKKTRKPLPESTDMDLFAEIE